MSKRWIIREPISGLFVGHGMGLLFFSKEEDAGQTTVVTFPNWQAAWNFAEEFMSPNGISVIIDPINVANDYATIPELIAAGYRKDLGLLLNNVEAHVTPQ